MDTKEFECTECGEVVDGPEYAYMMQINCPGCGRDVNAYPI